MESIITAAIVCGTAIYLAHMSKGFTPFIERGFTLLEKRAEAYEKEVTKPAPAKPEQMPIDLLNIALGEKTAWAQEDALKRLYELYADTGSWDRVRESFYVEASR